MVGRGDGAGVFVLRDDRTLVAMQPAEFDLEADFQDLLSEFPALLAGDQMDVEAPRRFMLVSPEQPVPDQEGGGRRWSLDHLFLDQDGIPTLVEVKRQSDTRLRREVIGQMLDYAAHGVSHWRVEGVRADFLRCCAEKGRDPASTLLDLIGEDAEEEAFWAQVRANLQAGRIRMLLVADRIPPEVRTIVEFMNRQMQPAEVLAVELRQFQGEGLKLLSPLVIGQTQAALERKGATGPLRRWTAETILEALQDQPAAHAAASAILQWCRTHAERLNTNASGRGSVGPVFVHQGALLYPFLIGADAQLSFYFDQLASKPPFSDPARLQAFRDRLADEGVASASALQAKRPALPLDEFTPAMTQGLLRAMEGFRDQLHAAADSPPELATSAGLSRATER